MSKKSNTPFTDLNGETICTGDIITYGLLAQHWKVFKNKDTFYMKIISEDSGKGYKLEMSEGMCFDDAINNTFICKEGCYT